MAGDTTKLVFELFGRDNASPVFDKFGRRVRSTADDIGFMTKATKGLIGAAAGYATFSVAADFLRDANTEARESQKVNALTANALKTTGAEAWTSAAAISDLAAAQSAKTAIDDEAIQTSANLLLTFKNVRNELGKGSDIFDRATAASLDLSASGFGSIDGAAKMLGKSLNDPVKGITALSRAGVTFSEGQKKQIKDLVKQNDLLGAQKIILREVESQVKGSAAAQATSGEKLTVAMDNAKEAIGTALLPVVDELSEALAEKAIPAGEALSEWLTDDAIPAVRSFYDEAKPVAQDVLPAIADAGDKVVDVFKFLAPMVGDAADAFSALPDAGQQALLLGAGIATLGGRARSLVPDLSNLDGSFDKTKAKSLAMKGGVGAAGLGLLAFSDDVHAMNDSVGTVTDVLGTAAVGFAAGGPWGLAVGAGVGIMQAFGDANKHAIPDIDALSGSLDKQTGYITGNTTALLQNALEKDGAFKKARQLGVGLGDVTDAASGDKAAMARIVAQREATAAESARLAEEQSPGSGLAQAAGVRAQFDKLTDSIGAQSGAVAEARQKWENLNESQRQSKTLNALTAEQVTNVAKATDGIPRRVITQFTQPGYAGAVQNVSEIAAKYKLTPKQVSTTLKALDYSSDDIKRVLRLMKEADAAKANPKVTVDTSQVSDAVRSAQRLINGMNGKTVRIAARGGGGGTTSSADGNILFFADGGTHDIANGHEPRIYRDGLTRVFNEPETGGEVYFPLAPSKQARSRVIAAQGVELLGGVAYFAKGGTTGKPKKKAPKSTTQTVSWAKPADGPGPITADEIAAQDNDPTRSAYDAVGQMSPTEARLYWLAQSPAVDPLSKSSSGGGSSSSSGSSSSTRVSTSDKALARALERAVRNGMDGAQIVLMENGKSMRATIRTRG